MLVTEPGVGPRAIDDGHVAPLPAKEFDLFVVQIVAVNDQGPMGMREHAKFVQRPAPRGRAAGSQPPRDSNSRKTGRGLAKKFDLLPRFGQVHGQRNLTLRERTTARASSSGWTV